MILYHGSTKIIEQYNDKISFFFTDDYSIYDFGKMPDQIPHKGKNLAKMTSILFKKLERMGAKTHFSKILGEDKIIVDKFAVPDIKNGYDIYQSNPTKTTVPLECIFRFGAPLGSSLLRAQPDLLPFTKFDSLKIEFSTKLESIDRKLTDQEAQTIAGLSHDEFENLRHLIQKYAEILHHEFQTVGLDLWDGKFEFAFGAQREFILMDSIGPDELRLTYKNLPLSKEYLRQIYLDTDWHERWKDGVRTTPPPLSSRQLKTASLIYTRITAALETGSFSLDSETLNDLAINNSHIAIFGQGGREHALAKALAKNKTVKQVSVIPGNPGMNSAKIKTYDLNKEQAIQFCRDQFINYAIIGPEDLIADGLSDQLEQAGIPCVAPSQKASLLESSKAFAKNFMRQYQIPTADFQIFANEKEARSFIEQSSLSKFVLKKSGLAAGKGVFMCEDSDSALEVISNFDWDKDTMVIEEYLEGPEVSLFALCQGEDFKILSTACDYKRLRDGNHGPNTGGMGCYSPADWVSEEDIQKLQETIIQPTLKGMKEQGRAFKGVLFVGLIKTNQGYKVLEYNIRFGDPETQTILPRIQSGFHELCFHLAHNLPLKPVEIALNNLASVHLVKASENYPYGSSKPQTIINNFSQSSQAELYFAGVRGTGEELESHGGRVLGLTTLAPNKEKARALVYDLASTVHFEGEQFREDIAK